MSAKNSVGLGPRGTCEVFNVVKQVQRDRKGSPARASRLVTLWPSHHRAGSAVGGDVQIALSFSFSPPILSLCLSSIRSHSLAHLLTHSLTRTYARVWITSLFIWVTFVSHEYISVLMVSSKWVCFYCYCGRILLNSFMSIGLLQRAASNL